MRDFPGSIVVKTSLCSAGVVDSIRGWGAKISHALMAREPKLNLQKSSALDLARSLFIQQGFTEHLPNEQHTCSPGNVSEEILSPQDGDKVCDVKTGPSRAQRRLERDI